MKRHLAITSSFAGLLVTSGAAYAFPLIESPQTSVASTTAPVVATSTKPLPVRDENVTVLNRAIVHNGVKILPISLEDTRCADHTNCLEEGTVELRVVLRREKKAMEVATIRLGEPIEFAGKNVTLADVSRDASESAQLTFSVSDAKTGN